MFLDSNKINSFLLSCLLLLSTQDPWHMWISRCSAASRFSLYLPWVCRPTHFFPNG